MIDQMIGIILAALWLLGVALTTAEYIASDNKWHFLSNSRYYFPDSSNIFSKVILSPVWLYMNTAVMLGYILGIAVYTTFKFVFLKH
jgi:hypothetical protein